jgi:3-hydroxy-9,10-secoandrosta-1,3,5(10)-triene-9,17-dione monooxygenase reductase component
VTGCVERYEAVTPDELRLAMAQFATGVTIVTSRDGVGTPVGTTANAVCSVSLDPPLVLVCLDRKSLTLQAVRDHGAFVLNVLGEAQRDLCAAFARRGSDGAWDGVRHHLCPTATPALSEALATLDCSVDRIDPGGDHEIVIGRVVETCIQDGSAPLLFHRGAYARLAVAESVRSP